MTFNFYEILKKIFCFILIVACIGLPIINVFSFLIIFVVGLVIINSKTINSPKRLAAAILVMLSVFLIKSILPRASLEEGHNVFFITKDNGVLEKELPPEVFSFMKQEFLKLYPADNQSRLTPKTLFSFSADSAFSKPKYSRIVDSINFSDLAEFRGGFANSLDYNWYGVSILGRENMTFFVMYELSPASVNSSLCWTGYVLWEDALGQYQAIYHQVRACRKIAKANIGKKVFGVSINTKKQTGFWGRFNVIRLKIRYFFSDKKPVFLAEDKNKEAYLSMRLNLSPLLKLSLILKRILEILGIFFILKLMVKIERKRLILPAIIIGIATLVVYLYCPQFFGQYFINEGGEDGLTHATLGREILANILSGNWLQAIRGGQDVFWDTPGFRYFRALEKLFFGDTNFGYLAVTLIFPYVFLGFLSSFISRKSAFWITIIFLIGILFHSHELEKLGFTYQIYVMVARGGWPDTLAYTAFLGAITLLLRYIGARNGAYYWYGFWGNFLLFITVFMRPQFVLAALIVVIYFAVRLIVSRRTKEMFFSTIGFVPVFFPLLHNYFFGHKFYLFTGAAHLSISVPPPVYFNAFKELLTSNYSGENLLKVIPHLKDMIGSWYRLIFLGVVFYAAFFKRKVSSDIKMLAIVCLSLHFVSLFVFATYFRYVFLTWALTIVVTIFLFSSLFSAKFCSRHSKSGTGSDESRIF
jgi:hypothetical protein